MAATKTIPSVTVNLEKPQRISFDAFTLDITDESLWKGSERIPLRPKAFALLKNLVAHPGQMLSKDRLLNILWPDCNVEDGALKHCVAEIRLALNDSARTPRLIETAHRRGYRFIGKIGAGLMPSQCDGFKAPGTAQIYPLVGRTSELALLERCLERALEGDRQIVFVTGEHGIGKTTLIDFFIDRLRTDSATGLNRDFLGKLWTARGQCVKSHGAHEPFMPFYEALTGLCRNSGHGRIIAALRRCAPLWLQQMPSLITKAQLRHLRQDTLGITRNRMLREMAEALEYLTANNLLILVLEDLHWSDRSTLDLISYLALRRERARFLLVASLRPTETTNCGYSPIAVMQGLLANRKCAEIALPFLDETAVNEYLKQRFPDSLFAAEFASWLHRHTDGNPLCMVGILNHLQTEGYIATADGRWVLNVPVEHLDPVTPPTIQRMLEQQIARCTPQERQLLQAASVEGIGFSAEGVAAVLGERVERIEMLCQGLARRGLLQLQGAHPVPDGRRIASYRFAHGICRSLLYKNMPAESRSRLHRRMAEHIEKSGDKKQAARLAMHFEKGGKPGRAIRYYLQGAEEANSRYAWEEGAELAKRGIEMLKRERGSKYTECEMRLQIAFGNALMYSAGLGCKAVDDAFGRALELFRSVGSSRQLRNRNGRFSAFHGIWSYYWVRGNRAVSQKCAEQLLRMAEAKQDAWMLGQACESLGSVFFDHGDFTKALMYLRKAGSIRGRCVAAWTKWMLGYPDSASRDIEEALAYACKTGIPDNNVSAHLGAALVCFMRKDSEKALDHAQSALDKAGALGLREWWAIAPMQGVQGWALAALGHVSSGFERAQQAVERIRPLAPTNLEPLVCAIFAETAIIAQQIESGMAAIERAESMARDTGVCFFDSEIHRLKAELLLRQATGGMQLQQRDRLHREAEFCLEKAARTARRQKARLLELRATIGLVRLLRESNRAEVASNCLMKLCDGFTEGFGTPDLLEARKLLYQGTNPLRYSSTTRSASSTA